MAATTIGAATSELRTGLLGRLPADRLVIRCGHGSTTSYLLLGSDEPRNEAALELVRQRHSDRIGCTCTPERVPVRELAPAPESAAVPGHTPSTKHSRAWASAPEG